MYELIALFGAGLVAGLVNSVAGGGALLMYPLLLSLGLPPIVANATTTISIWPGALSSAYGYRKYIKKIPKYYFWLLVPGLLGGIIGAVILRKTSNHSFKLVVPWLIIMAVLLLSFQPKIHKWLKKRKKNTKKAGALSFILIAIAIFAMSIYGGFFGAGLGIIMLAVLGFTKLTDIHQLNGLKNLIATFINLVASIYFIHYHLIDWHYTPLLLLGTVIGGYIGATYSNKLPSHLIRKIIIIIGASVGIVLLVDSFYKSVL
jgi:uncharacterized membrane protein YfcA